MATANHSQESFRKPNRIFTGRKFFQRLSKQRSRPVRFDHCTVATEALLTVCDAVKSCECVAFGTGITASRSQTAQVHCHTVTACRHALRATQGFKFVSKLEAGHNLTFQRTTKTKCHLYTSFMHA